MNPEFIHRELKLFINGEPHSIGNINGKPRGCIFGNELFQFSPTENGIKITTTSNIQIITRDFSFSPIEGVKVEIKKTI